MNAPFAIATAVTPGWMPPPEYTPRHAAPETRTAVDPALSRPEWVDDLRDLFRTAHWVVSPAGGDR